MKNKRISNSFRYAFTEMGTAFKTVRNVKIRVIITLIVIVSGFFLGLNVWKWLVCISWFAIVIGGELFNAAIAIVVDLSMPKINENAKRSKDNRQVMFCFLL